MIGTITDSVVQYCANTSFSSLPDVVVERTKMVIFDEICCAIIGRELAAGDLITKYVISQGGQKESTVLGTNLKVPAALAALANGTSGHADEYDGTHVTDGHPGAAIVPSVLATAERLRSTGAEVITAVALGHDIGTRIVSANGGGANLRNVVHVQCCYLHCFGAAAASARLMSLNSDGIRHALALSAGHSGGLAVIFSEKRHMSKALTLGQPAYAGVFAATLASIGFEGNWNIFDTDHNPLNLSPKENSNSVFDDLGINFAMLGSNIKFFSAGYPIHSPIEAALSIISDNKLNKDDIKSVEVSMRPDSAYVVTGREIATISAQHMIALSIVHGHLDFDLAHKFGVLNDPRVLTLCDKITILGDPEIERLQPGGRGARVIIDLKSGERFNKWVPHPRGHALAGKITWEDIFDKWDNIMSRRLQLAEYERFKYIVSHLESVDDISALFDAISPQ